MLRQRLWCLTVRIADLTKAEAALAIQQIVRGDATPAQAGAFLIAQRVKGEALEEILGFTRGAREAFVTTLAPRVDDLLDLGVPYDGKAKTAQLVPAVTVLLAACGVPVIVHGAQGIPTKNGITLMTIVFSLLVIYPLCIDGLPISSSSSSSFKVSLPYRVSR